MRNLGKSFHSTFAIIAVWVMIERSWAGEIEPLRTALVSILGKVSAQHVGKRDLDYWHPKAPKGKVPRVVFIEKNIYPPNCTHTWAIGIDTKSGRVVSVHALQMSCQHGYPAMEKSFLSQFQGKGISDLKSLDGIDTIAKATGTCQLAAKAVKASITKFQRIKGNI